MGSDPVITDLIMTPPRHNLTVLTKHANGKKLPISWFISISPTDRHRLYFVIIFCSLSFFFGWGVLYQYHSKFFENLNDFECMVLSNLKRCVVKQIPFYVTNKLVNNMHHKSKISWFQFPQVPSATCRRIHIQTLHRHDPIIMSYIDTTVVVSYNFKLYTVDNRIASGCHEHSYGMLWEPWK